VSDEIRVRRLEAGAMDEVRPRLVELLLDSVEKGATVGFLEPLDANQADAYWRRVGSAVADGRVHLLVAEGSDGTVVGTIQLEVDTLPSQSHRATLGKLLVHSAARRHGVGEALMRAVEHEALDAGRRLLLLDTATPAAERLYERLGWTLIGIVPRWARDPEGRFADAWFYWKDLTETPPQEGEAPEGSDATPSR
jgi:ribosomal protein S18 acetylase RimI-like enzyme